MIKDESRESFTIALGHLREVKELSPSTTPRMVTHGAYYSMYHAARAVRLEADGEASTKHGKTASRFASFAADLRTPDAVRCSNLLRVAAERRNQADYTGEEISPEEAADSLAAAEEFLAFAARRLGLATDIP